MDNLIPQSRTLWDLCIIQSAWSIALKVYNITSVLADGIKTVVHYLAMHLSFQCLCDFSRETSQACRNGLLSVDCNLSKAILSQRPLCSQVFPLSTYAPTGISDLALKTHDNFMLCGKILRDIHA